MDFTLVAYLGAWYIGNMVYSTYNKLAERETGGKDFAVAIATTQLLVGVLYSVYLWIAPECRPFPKDLKIQDIVRLIPAGICSAGAHAASVFSLAAGGVAFGQIVKSTEPVFAAIIGTVFYNKKVSSAKWLCLIPIIGGVAITVLKPKGPDAKIHEFTAGEFNIMALVGGMFANSFAAVKGNETHKALEDKELAARLGSPINNFSVMTFVSFVVSIPLVWVYPIVYGMDAEANVSKFYDTFTTNRASLVAIVISGYAFHLYNEFSTLSLKKLSPVTSSVANTFKRVFVIVAGILMYEDERKKATIYTAIGCVICMLGVGLYACIDDLMKGKEDKKKEA